uniref:Serpin family F member 2 n=2 Tax=Zonotrichia albicollis TaxID=44394 RepID=A0A8D2NDK2_ZONAL
MRVSLSSCSLLVSPQDVKSAGIAQSDLLGAIPALPEGKMVEFSYDSFQENDGAMSALPSTLPDSRDAWNSEDEAVAGAGGCRGEKSPGENASAEEEGDKSCELTWKTSQKLADGLMRFSIDLLREVELESNRSNVILSPLSIALALSHLALGAANQTEKRLLEVMHLESVPCLHQMLGTLGRRLSESTLSLGSRLYLQKGFEVKEKFLEDSEKFYGAKPKTLSGINQDDLVAINSWVKDVTHGKIPSFLQQLPQNTVMLLLNAIYFHGFWRNKFNASFTGPDVFHLDNEFVVPVEMMKAHQYPLSWFTLESQDIQVAKFPFKSNVSFVVIVPNHNTRDTSHVLENFPYKQLCRLFPREVPTTVKIPKIKLDQKLELNQVLSQMGKAPGRVCTEQDQSVHCHPKLPPLFLKLCLTACSRTPNPPSSSSSPPPYSLLAWHQMFCSNKMILQRFHSFSQPLRVLPVVAKTNFPRASISVSLSFHSVSRTWKLSTEKMQITKHGAEIKHQVLPFWMRII